MKAILALLLGVIIGVGLLWLFSAEDTQSELSEAGERIESGAEKLGDKIRGAWEEIDTEEVKKELKETGRVVRRKTEEMGEAAAKEIDDARISTTIKGKLATDDTVSALAIDVDTEDGIVTLSGTVDSHQEIAQAMELALTTKGVREVVSTLRVEAEAEPAAVDKE